jgi:adenylate cyclase
VGNLLGATGLRHGAPTITWDLTAIIVLGLITFAAAQLPSPAAAGLAAACVLLGWGVVAQFAFERHLLWLNATFPAASILLSAGVSATLRAFSERRLRRDAQRERANLSRYHSPVIAEMLARGDAAALPEQEQEAAILFVDMTGSTQRAEGMTPAETAHFLRDFHRRIESAVLRHDGVLEHFTGDGAMVIFGVPAPSPQDAASALAAARDLIAGIRQWSQALEATGEPPLQIRIGIHYGRVVIAALGGDAHRQLTAAGDTVNVASRLEALARAHGAAIAISAEVAEAVRAAGGDALLQAFVPLPAQQIRGREAKLVVWIATQADLRAQVTDSVSRPSGS